MSMPYRRLGTSGLKISALSFGAWVTFGKQVGDRTARDLMHISSVILGASRVEQLQENLGAPAIMDQLTPEVMQRIDALTVPLAD